MDTAAKGSARAIKDADAAKVVLAKPRLRADTVAKQPKVARARPRLRAETMAVAGSVASPNFFSPNAVVSSVHNPWNGAWTGAWKPLGAGLRSVYVG